MSLSSDEGQTMLLITDQYCLPMIGQQYLQGKISIRGEGYKNNIKNTIENNINEANSTWIWSCPEELPCMLYSSNL